jgi:hypothetical protein
VLGSTMLTGAPEPPRVRLPVVRMLLESKSERRSSSAENSAPFMRVIHRNFEKAGSRESERTEGESLARSNSPSSKGDDGHLDQCWRRSSCAPAAIVERESWAGSSR